MYKIEGLRGFLRAGINVIHIAPYYATQFLLYEGNKRFRQLGRFFFGTWRLNPSFSECFSAKFLIAHWVSIIFLFFSFLFFFFFFYFFLLFLLFFFVFLSFSLSFFLFLCLFLCLTFSFFPSSFILFILFIYIYSYLYIFLYTRICTFNSSGESVGRWDGGRNEFVVYIPIRPCPVPPDRADERTKIHRDQGNFPHGHTGGGVSGFVQRDANQYYGGCPLCRNQFHYLWKSKKVRSSKFYLQWGNCKLDFVVAGR